MAGPACETHRLSNLIDILLKSFISKVQSYVRDDIDFLKYILKIVPQNTLLVSFVVVNLYTNISHDLGIKAINSWLTKYPELIHERFSKEFILESIKLYLKTTISILMIKCISKFEVRQWVQSLRPHMPLWY